jgi:hypothetical protein
VDKLMRHILLSLLDTQTMMKTIDITKSLVIIIIVAKEKFRTENNEKNNEKNKKI